jgi:tetratricopeptide (TPR) repeat protein
MRCRTVGRQLLLSLVGAVTMPIGAGAAPSVPTSDARVIEVLPSRSDARLAAIERAHNAGQSHTVSAVAAVELAGRFVEAARQDGDPRYLGYAQSLLERPGLADSIQRRVLHAIVLQSLHRFDEAIAELGAVLQRQPDHGQALVTRATVLLVVGRHAEARRDCMQLWRRGGPVTASLCLASVAAASGQPAAAARLAQRALDDAPESDLAAQGWGRTLLAEIAMVRNQDATAAALFAEALAATPGDRYLRAAYCDFLLSRGRAAQVLALTDQYQRDDNLLLRRAIALKTLVGHEAARQTDGNGPELRMRQRELAVAIEALQARHNAARRRGERTHLREEARLTLELLGNPVLALRLARENWRIQKEPADARILQQAALAAGDARTLSQLQQWQRAVARSGGVS